MRILHRLSSDFTKLFFRTYRYKVNNSDLNNTSKNKDIVSSSGNINKDDNNDDDNGDKN
jgi:hypothetical protein